MRNTELKYINTLNEKSGLKLSMDNIQCIPACQITDEDIEETYRIESQVLAPELVADSEVTRAWYRHNPFTLVGVKDISMEKLVGFLHAIPISDKLFENIMSGNFDDTAFTVSDIMQYNRPGFYKLYIASFCVCPKYQNNIHLFKLIYNGFIEMLTMLAVDHDIIISEIAADGATKVGKSLCKNIGMRRQAYSTHGTDVYHASVIPPEFSTIRLKCVRGQTLLEIYNNKWRDSYGI